jgi:hypothetical protein
VEDTAIRKEAGLLQFVLPVNDATSIHPLLVSALFGTFRV